MTTPMQRREAASAKTGEFVNNTVALDLQRLLERGLLVRIHVHGTGLFNSALSFEELGIKTDSLEGKAKSARRIIDAQLDNRLNSWGAQCRQAAIRYASKLESVDALTASASWRFLLYSAYEDFKTRWNELMALGRQIKADAIVELPNIREQNRQYYEQRARENWDALQARYAYGTAISVPGNTFGPDDCQRYIEWVVAQAMAAIPTEQDIESKIFANYQTSVLFITTMPDSAERSAIWQEENERARAELENSTSAVRELLGQLFAQLAEGTKTLLDGYNKNGQFRGRSLDVARNFPTLMRYLGGEFLEDAEIRGLIEQAKSLAETSSSEQRDGQLVANLHQLQSVVTAQLDELKATRVTHTRAAYLEL
ncbi:MAG: hypothetical protein WC359_13250 [Dehalococcoidia bacterium]